MGVVKLDGTANRFQWTTLSTALANVSDAAFTCAALLKRNTATTFDAVAYLKSGTGNGVAEEGLSIRDTDEITIDNGTANIFSSLTITSATEVHIIAGRKNAGADAPTYSRYTKSTNTWAAHNTVATTCADQIPSTMLEIGAWQTTGDFFDGWIGVVGFWEGRMSDAQVQELSLNWRTSDWLLRNSFGRPLFLTELNTFTPVDLTGNASAMASAGTMVMTPTETLMGWFFDGQLYKRTTGLRPASFAPGLAR